MKLQISYGIENNNINVTDIVYDKCLKHDIIYIPANDNKRSELFTDPLLGITKLIIIKDEHNNIKYYDIFKDIFIDTKTNSIYTDNIPDYISKIYPQSKLKNLQNKLILHHGSFFAELPEQLMAVQYLNGNEKVLEIGGNIGRCSMIIASILHDDKNLVTLESDNEISKQLINNKETNNLNFHVENSALSKRKLIQKGWETVCSDIILEGYHEVNTITLEELNHKYKIKFDTLVIDCEGAFYYILLDMPEILDNINLIIMENDYVDFSHKQYIDNVLRNNNFNVDYVESGGWGPCYNNFYEVWKKNLS